MRYGARPLSVADAGVWKEIPFQERLSRDSVTAFSVYCIQKSKERIAS